jgi:HEAT repeat protein
MAIVILSFTSAFLYDKYRTMNAPPPAPPPPVMTHDMPQPLFTEAEVRSIRHSTKDGDAGVRWAAMQLLFTIKDPESTEILSRTVADDPDPEVRMNAIRLLGGSGDSRQLPGLIKGLTDTEQDVRLSSLKALGDIGDPAAAPYVAALLKDPDAEVKTAALHTLGRFQDKRTAEFRAMADQLRRQYENAVKKSQENLK